MILLNTDVRGVKVYISLLKSREREREGYCLDLLKRLYARME